MNGTAIFQPSPIGAWSRRAMVVTGFVILTVGLATVIALTARQTWSSGVNNPQRYAAKMTRTLSNELGLTPSQADTLQTLLRDHRESVNTIDHDELMQWEALFQNLPTALPTDQQRQMAAINDLQARRNRLRLQSLAQINALLTPDQRGAYSRLMVQLANKLQRQQSDAQR